MTDESRAPNQRSFSLNSDEAYAALCPPRERPWIPNGALPREPRVWEREVILEANPKLGEMRGQSAGGARGLSRANPSDVTSDLFRVTNWVSS